MFYILGYIITFDLHSNSEIAEQELILLFLILIHGDRVSAIQIIRYVRMVILDK